jgi:hypothetical protein
MGKRWERLKAVSSWRKISVGMWGEADDPTIYGFETLDVTELLDYLDEVSEASGKKVTLTSFLVASVARVLAEYPDLNVITLGPKIFRRHTVDIFCQVALASSSPGSADLSGVKIRDADRLDLVEISEILGGRARRLREGRDRDMEATKSQVEYIPASLMRAALRLLDFLTYTIPIDLDALGVRSDPFGSAMVTSVAQFDIKQGFAPLVPMAHCPLLLLPGAVHDVVLPVDGEPKVRRGLTISCTFDHRVYDGLQIGFIVRDLRNYIEHPRRTFPAPSSFAIGEEASNEEHDPPTPQDERHPRTPKR